MLEGLPGEDDIDELCRREDWCGPCRIEMPEFEAIDEARKADGFAIIAVNKVASLADIQGFRDKLGLSFILAMDECANIHNQYNIFSYPSTFSLDRVGTILARHFGSLHCITLAHALSRQNTLLRLLPFYLHSTTPPRRQSRGWLRLGVRFGLVLLFVPKTIRYLDRASS